MKFKLLKFLKQRKRRKAPRKMVVHSSSPTNPPPQILKVSDALQLTTQGIPSNLSRKHREVILLSLLRNTLSHLPERPYTRGERLYQGEAHLHINGDVCKIVYTLDAIRAITALDVYKQAFDIVTKGASAEIFDTELAELTADYFRQSAWQELLLSRYRRKSDPDVLELTLSEEDNE